MRVSATHIVLEHSGMMSDNNFIFHKVYEMSDGEYMIEMKDGIFWLDAEIFATWSENYNIFINTKK